MSVASSRYAFRRPLAGLADPTVTAFMGTTMSVLRHRRLLTGIVEQTHAIVADLEQAVGLDPSPPLVRLIDPARAFMLLADEALREHQEIHDVSTKRTPLRPPSSSCLAAVSGISDRVGAILDEGKKIP